MNSFNSKTVFILSIIVDFTNNKTSKRERIECDKVLIAVGRKANIDKSVSKLGIKLDKENRKLIQEKEKYEMEKKSISKTKDKTQFEKSKQISVKIEELTLKHEKEIARQEVQNKLYDQII